MKPQEALNSFDAVLKGLHEKGSVSVSPIVYEQLIMSYRVLEEAIKPKKEAPKEEKK